MICCSMTLTLVTSRSTDDVRAEVSSPMDRELLEALEPLEVLDFSEKRTDGCD